MATLNIYSILDTGKYRGKKVGEMVDNKDKAELFKLIKKGYSFNDEVLSLIGIKKNVRDVKVSQILVDHVKDKKVYQKDTASLSKILKELRTIDNLNENEIQTYSSPSDSEDINDD